MNMKIQNGENSDALVRSSKESNRRKDDNKHNQNGKVINASQLNLQDDIVMKKVQARKQAVKTIMDAFSGEYNVDETIHSQMKRAQDLSQEANTSLEEINRLKDLKTQLKDSYGVEDDSQEQKDLELLEKQQRINSGDMDEKLTEEEKTKLSNMGTPTEYQNMALEYSSISNTFQKRLDSINNTKKSVNLSVESMKVEQVKSHALVDAQKTADNIMEAASDEIVSTLVDEAKDSIDKKIQKEQEDAKKKAEEEQALKEKLDQNKDKEQANSGTVDQLSEITKADSNQDKLQKEIQNMIDNQKMLAEDVKGIAVDETM